MTEKPATAAAAAGSRLISVDALRGAAALAVVFFHATHQANFIGTAGTPRWIGVPVATVISFGYIGVYLFFVISGFCIHLRWAKAKAAGKSTSIDFFAFWKRRIRRLYPPYLIAMCFYLVVLAVMGKLRLTSFFWWDLSSHLLMLHNFDNRTAYGINGVFWTLAIEEHLYLAYFLLIVLRVRFGWARALAFCLAARLAWFALSFVLVRRFGFQLPVTEAAAAQWFVWALGALSVEAALGIVKLPAWCRDLRLASFVLALTATISYLDRFYWDPRGHLHEAWWLLVHPMWGLGFFILINRAAFAERAWRAAKYVPRFVTAFAGIGLFSYSLYLTHELILDHLANHLAALYQWPRMTTLLVSLFILSPLSVLFAWVFFLLFEKPFISWAQAASKSAPILKEEPAGILKEEQAQA